MWYILWKGNIQITFLVHEKTKNKLIYIAMKKQKKFISSMGYLGVIILGIVTSALWDVLKPLTKFLFEFALNLSILGVEKFKDGIYQEVAKGFHEGVSLEIFIVVHSFLLGIMLASFLILVFIRRRFSDDYIKEKTSFTNKITDKFFLFHKNLSKNRSFAMFLVLYLSFAGTITTLTLVKQKYINDATTHFEQLSEIVRPYISVEQDILYRSSFFQIQNKEDYVKLIDNLEQIAIEKELKVPEFSFTF